MEHGYCDEVLNGVGCDLAAADVYCVAKASSLTRRSPSKNMALQSCISFGKSSKTKKSGLLSKKIRKLSSLTGQRQLEHYVCASAIELSCMTTRG